MITHTTHRAEHRACNRLLCSADTHTIHTRQQSIGVTNSTVHTEHTATYAQTNGYVLEGATMMLGLLNLLVRNLDDDNLDINKQQC